MKTSNTANRLKELMELRKLRQVDILKLCEPFCKKYDVRLERNDLSQYISGKAKPKQDKLTILGLALNVSPVWLMGYDVPRVEDLSALVFENVKPLTKVRIPVLGEISCGIPKYASEEREVYVQVGTEIKADFCLIARGDSMIGARIHDGDIIFVRKQDVVDNGDIAVVIIDDDATLKRVFYYPEKRKLVLQAENPAYEPFVYVGEELDQIKILGKAVAFQSDVK